MTKITDPQVIAETAKALEQCGYYDDAERVRKQGAIYLNGGRPPKEETQLNLLKFAKLCLRYRELRKRLPVRAAKVRCCEEFQLLDKDGDPDIQLVDRILNGKIPGVSELRKTLEDEAEEEALNKAN